MLLHEPRGGRVGEQRNKEVKRTHIFFVDDLKVYQESHKILKEVNKIIVQASHDTRACYGVAKEIRKMVKGEGLQVLREKRKTLTHDQKEIYEFQRKSTKE